MSRSQSGDSTMAQQEESLHSNLSQCLMALRRVQSSYVNAHPLIKRDMRTMDGLLSDCISMLQSSDKSTATLYPHCHKVLRSMQSTYHGCLTSYFTISPLWLHYLTNMDETITALARWCHRTTDDLELDENGNEIGSRFNREFIPMDSTSRIWYGRHAHSLWTQKFATAG